MIAGPAECAKRLNPPRGLSPSGVSDPVVRADFRFLPNRLKQLFELFVNNSTGAPKPTTKTWLNFSSVVTDFVKIDHFTSAPASSFWSHSGAILESSPRIPPGALGNAIFELHVKTHGFQQIDPPMAPNYLVALGNAIFELHVKTHGFLQIDPPMTPN